MAKTLTDIYEYYCESGCKVEKSIFKDICCEFNMEIIDVILSGKSFSMGNNLSSLSVVRMQRDPRNPAIDWGESNKYKDELLASGEEVYDKETGSGVKWHIYHTDDFYCKYYWNKGRCKVKNKSAYRFDPTRGIKGNKEKLTRLLKTDDLAYLRFKKHGSI